MTKEHNQDEKRSAVRYLTGQCEKSTHRRGFKSTNIRYSLIMLSLASGIKTVLQKQNKVFFILLEVEWRTTESSSIQTTYSTVLLVVNVVCIDAL